MPASRRLYVNRTFDITGWAGGEYGLLPIWEAPKNSFTGTNVMRYVGGALGPRYGVKQITLSGSAITGAIQGMGFNLYVPPGNDTWIVIGTAVYVMNSGTGAVTLCTGTLASIPINFVHGVSIGTKTYIGNDGDKIYVIDHVANTVTAVAGSPTTCEIMVQYGEFTCVSGQASATNQFVYSAPSDPTTWPAQNFINVGNGARITGMWNQRDHLVLATADGGWWVLRGVPGSNAVLRRMGDNVSPLYQENASILGNGLLAFTLGSSSTGSVASLGTFNGSLIKMVPYLFFGNGRGVTFPVPSHKVVAAKEEEDWFVLGASSINPNVLTMHARGVYSQHQFQISGVNLNAYIAGSPVSDTWILTDGGSVGVTPKFYYFRQYANRPAFTTDAFMQPGDASTTPFTANFTTEEFTNEAGLWTQPMEITVDFLSWATGSPSSNHFDLSVITNRMYNTGGTPSAPVITTSIGSYDDPGGSEGSAGGTRLRYRFGSSALPMSNGFQIQFTNIRGVAIERIMVHTTNELTRE